MLARRLITVSFFWLIRNPEFRGQGTFPTSGSKDVQALHRRQIRARREWSDLTGTRGGSIGPGELLPRIPQGLPRRRRSCACGFWRLVEAERVFARTNS